MTIRMGSIYKHILRRMINPYRGQKKITKTLTILYENDRRPSGWGVFIKTSSEDVKNYRDELWISKKHKQLLYENNRRPSRTWPGSNNFAMRVERWYVFPRDRPLLKRGLMVFVRVDQHSSTLTTDQIWFPTIFNDFGRWLLISISQFYRKRFFLKKKEAPAGKWTRGKQFLNDS